MSGEMEVWQPAPLAEHDSWVPIVHEVANLAKFIANTDFVPKGLRGNPAAVTAAVLTGRELHLGPMASLGHIDVIDGTPTADAEIMRALVLQQGHEIRPVSLSKTRVVLKGRRKEWDPGDWTEMSFTIEEAKDRGLDGKQNWRRMPQEMLVARCTSRLCRLLFADVVAGIPFTPDEVGDESPSEAAPDPGAPSPAPRLRSRRKPAELAAPAETPGVDPAPAAPATDAAMVPARAAKADLLERAVKLGWPKDAAQALCRQLWAEMAGDAQQVTPQTVEVIADALPPVPEPDKDGLSDANDAVRKNVGARLHARIAAAGGADVKQETHASIILLASEGRTTHASELDEDEAKTAVALARDIADGVLTAAEVAAHGEKARELFDAEGREF